LHCVSDRCTWKLVTSLPRSRAGMLPCNRVCRTVSKGVYTGSRIACHVIDPILATVQAAAHPGAHLCNPAASKLDGTFADSAALPGPPQLPSGGMPGPPLVRPAHFTPSSFPQGAPQPSPAPSGALPLPRPQARPAGPPPALLPPGKTTPPAGAGAAPPSATPALRPTEPLKKLMASVTFIAPTVENEFLEKLFGVFGAVKSMKRPQDPASKAYKTFAFVEYETPESLRVALRVRIRSSACVAGSLRCVCAAGSAAAGRHACRCCQTRR
jgi:hypothetical protein